jgi:hypothetical protein
VENAPALQLDKILYKHHAMLPRTKRERRIVWNLFKHLEARGWHVTSIDDGELINPVKTPLAAMELIFDLDDCLIFFSNGKAAHYVSLILGNDLDVISDWSFAKEDADGFSAVMGQFDPEEFA